MQRYTLHALAGVLFVAFAVIPAVPAAAASSETYRQLNLFGDVFERVRADYVKETEDEKLIEDAINGMLQGLDPHSSYLNPRNFRDMQVTTKGEYGGLGIEVTMESGLVKVVAPMDDTPADRAGVKAGDLFSHLDGKPIRGMSLDEALDIMRGRPGTDLTITVLRKGVREPFDITITRAIIEIKSVRHRAEGNIGYIRITTFNEHTGENVRSAIRSLKRSIGAGKLEGYVLDLRNNPGGLLDQAIEVSDAFLNKGEIVSTRGRNNNETQRYSAQRGDTADGKPVVVLINGGSASASEIVAGALQDHRRAILLGNRSFGKGSVQTVIPLNGGANGALRLTTALYYTPGGRTIQAEGIEPDIEVDIPRPDGAEAPGRTSSVRRRPRESDLPNHLENENGSGEETGEPEKAAPPAEEESEEGQPGADASEESEEEVEEASEPEDTQLNRALELLRGISLNAKRMEGGTRSAQR